MGRLGHWRDRMGRTRTVLGEKVREALASVLPITAIVLALCFTISPVPTDTLLAFFDGRRAADCRHGSLHPGGGDGHDSHR